MFAVSPISFLAKIKVKFGWGRKMPEEARDFWNRELSGVNMDEFRCCARRLCPTDMEFIRQRYEALMIRERYVGIFVSRHKNIKRGIIEFAQRLGATDEEIKLDVLPSLNLVQ